MAELNYNGLSIDRYPDILENTEDKQRELIHPDINTQDNEFLGHMNQILAEREALIQELIQAVYDSGNILKAEGKNLDDLATLRETKRADAEYSSTHRQRVTGKNGTIIPARSVFTNSITEDQFVNPSQISVDMGECIEATLSVKQLLDNEEYELKVNTTTYGYTSGTSATKQQIIDGIYANIDGDINKSWTVEKNGDSLTIATDDYNFPISIVPISYIGPDSVTVEGYIEATEYGDVVASPNTITGIVAPPIGFTGTSNAIALTLGRLEETDEELRVRIQNNRGSDSTGTVPSITNALLNNVDGVISVSVIANSSHLIDEEGRPPYSYESVVVGGVNSDVASELWRTSPAGTPFYGNTTIAITDSNGTPRDVSFTRPTVVNVAIDVEYKRYDEEIFPLLGEDLIQEAVTTYINGLDLGNDIIPRRVSSAIDANVPGIEELTIQVQQIDNPSDSVIPANWQSNKFSVSATQYVNVTESDIYIQEVL